jgi:hypothetical protein
MPLLRVKTPSEMVSAIDSTVGWMQGSFQLGRMIDGGKMWWRALSISEVHKHSGEADTRA